MIQYEFVEALRVLFRPGRSGLVIATDRLAELVSDEEQLRLLLAERGDMPNLTHPSQNNACNHHGSQQQWVIESPLQPLAAKPDAMFSTRNTEPHLVRPPALCYEYRKLQHHHQTQSEEQFPKTH